MTPARVGTIIWGTALLLIGAAGFALVAWDIEEVADFSLAHVVVGLGALLVLAALVGAIARAVKSPVVEAPAATDHQPVD